MKVRAIPCAVRVLSWVVLFASVLACRGRRDAPNLYHRYCADCHGVEGGGDGRFTSELEVRPTDFRRAIYKFKHTASGERPTLGDIARTLDERARGTGMIPQLQLSEGERIERASYYGSGGLRCFVPYFPRLRFFLGSWWHQDAPIGIAMDLEDRRQ